MVEKSLENDVERQNGSRFVMTARVVITDEDYQNLQQEMSRIAPDVP